MKTYSERSLHLKQIFLLVQGRAAIQCQQKTKNIVGHLYFEMLIDYWALFIHSNVSSLRRWEHWKIQQLQTDNRGAMTSFLILVGSSWKYHPFSSWHFKISWIKSTAVTFWNEIISKDSYEFGNLKYIKESPPVAPGKIYLRKIFLFDFFFLLNLFPFTSMPPVQHWDISVLVT